MNSCDVSVYFELKPAETKFAKQLTTLAAKHSYLHFAGNTFRLYTSGSLAQATLHSDQSQLKHNGNTDGADKK